MLEVIGHKALGILSDYILSKFKNFVIDKWSSYRVNVFLNTLCKELIVSSSNVLENDVKKMIDEIINDDIKSEILFESYRKVFMSASKNIGPRVIAILTSKIISENRIATQYEEQMFLVSESLIDLELKELGNFLNENLYSYDNNKGIVYIEIDKEQVDLNREYEIQILDLTEFYGVWAVKAKNLGIICDTLKESVSRYYEDSERHIDEDGTIKTFTWNIRVNTTFKEFGELIKKSSYD
ncbi:hypothetical protein [Fluviispira sanaruensis]|uniref:Uncharacterized protein n=1 Tax=Fluviispira sanaruensis TaxID=2493639 RepID=A0A4P2VNK9_FLUSA|nr:hypothetical protein [Fluviispira sanaruensis]BBH53734.1 hypothetical protein JCM31447_21820 [Fluviispira sanaruensis]